MGVVISFRRITPEQKSPRKPGHPDLPVPLDHPDLQESLARKAEKAILEYKGPGDHQGLVPLAQWVLQGLGVIMGLKDQLDLQVLTANRAHQVLKGQ